MLPLQRNRGIDHWLTVRKAWVAHLIANSAAIGVAPEKIWGESPPANIKWPFIRLGFSDSQPWIATGLSGSELIITTHAFSKTSDTGEISNIAAAIVDCIETFTIPTLDLVDRQWTGTTTIRDGDEASAFHSIINMTLIAVQPTSG